MDCLCRNDIGGSRYQKVKSDGVFANARTELAFRQAVGRVVRSLGKKDMSSAYVIMPILKTLEKYAQRIENEIGPIARKAPQKPTKKICPSCEHECELNDKECSECGHEFPEPKKQFKKCENCGQLNPVSADECSSCGKALKVILPLSYQMHFEMAATR